MTCTEALKFNFHWSQIVFMSVNKLCNDYLHKSHGVYNKVFGWLEKWFRSKVFEVTNHTVNFKCKQQAKWGI